VLAAMSVKVLGRSRGTTASGWSMLKPRDANTAAVTVLLSSSMASAVARSAAMLSSIG